MHERAGRSFVGRFLRRGEQAPETNPNLNTENVKLDYSFPEIVRNPHELALNTAKLGVLADRGFLFMEIGGINIEVTNKNIATRRYGPEIQLDKIRLELTPTVVDFILKEAGFEKNDNPAEIMPYWFTSAIHLKRTATDSNAYVLKTGGENFPVNPAGIKSAWLNSGMPDMEYTLTGPRTVQIHMPYPED